MKLSRSGEDLLRGSGLEYTYLDVDDEERDGKVFFSDNIVF